MGQSLSKLIVHIIFHTKRNRIKIRSIDDARLYAYIGKIILDNGSYPICINGTHNHVHVLLRLSPKLCLSKQVEEIKRHSSRWIKTLDNHYNHFAWQSGYGAFSVDYLNVDKVIRYIENQKEHHKTVSKRDEYIAWLKRMGMDFDEDYLWRD